ncbi:hypothetical protein [Thermococcus aciditolerans]|uniref:Uncharacterized protein n=1 Tax=Thermococcus aciditolerans TaxID=2598455 RepID=A0A5C0SN03_9EURY|nr:hypothetical protein [Thermococcus aciditolerans]QEK15362.1 hypothetical protein FPV09_09965 [Thermococcus aciditolerans]
MGLEVAATVLSAIVGALSFGYSVVQGRSLGRRRFFKPNLLSHSVVKQEYESLKEQALEYSRSKRKESLLCATIFVNGLLFLALVVGRFSAGSEEAASLFFVIVGWWISLNLLFILLKKASIPEVKLNPKEVENALNGSTWIFLASIVMFIIVVLRSLSVGSPTSSSILYSLSVAVAGIGAILSAILFSSIIDIGTALLWKIYVSDSNRPLAEKLPHLLVKTKTGNIFFGQLYDPLDDKLLILRKAKLVIHGGQDVADTLGKVISHAVPHEKQGNYFLIPWDEIETLQIVESGLYAQRTNQYRGGDSSKEKSGLRCMVSWLFKNTIVKFWGLFKKFGLWIKGCIRNPVRRIDNELRRRFC